MPVNHYYVWLRTAIFVPVYLKEEKGRVLEVGVAVGEGVDEFTAHSYTTISWFVDREGGDEFTGQF